MKYAGIYYNDTSSAPGICVSFYTQGCPHHCEGCHNPETWDFNGGKELEPNFLDTIIEKLHANGINRSFCILGGEPLCVENAFLTRLLVSTVKEKSPETKIYVWTGYLYEDLQKSNEPHIKAILSNIDCLIDGPYIKQLRDITLPMRGSSNQKIIYFDKKENK